MQVTDLTLTKKDHRVIMCTPMEAQLFLTIHEASRECVWLRSVVYHILKTTALKTEDQEPTTLYEDNDASIAQLKGGYIKGDKMKYISPKFF